MSLEQTEIDFAFAAGMELADLGILPDCSATHDTSPRHSLSERIRRLAPPFDDYIVSDSGEVWSTKFQKPRKLHPSAVGHSGRPNVILCIKGKTFGRHVHRLVLEAFVGSRPLGMECRHLNGDCTDNRLVNLAWGTREENIADSKCHLAIKHGRLLDRLLPISQNAE